MMAGVPELYLKVGGQMRLFIKDIPSELVEKGKRFIQRYLHLNVLRFMLDGIDKSGELWHHGVKGQKWGERNGPPYPLSESARSPEEKRAAEKKSGSQSGESSRTRSEKDIAKQRPSSLKKGIRNLEARIAEHEAKIQAPQKHCKDWVTYDERRKAGLLEHWNDEIRTFQKNIQNRIDELKKRGEWK